MNSSSVKIFIPENEALGRPIRQGRNLEEKKNCFLGLGSEFKEGGVHFFLPWPGLSGPFSAQSPGGATVYSKPICISHRFELLSGRESQPGPRRHLSSHCSLQCSQERAGCGRLAAFPSQTFFFPFTSQQEVVYDQGCFPTLAQGLGLKQVRSVLCPERAGF